MAAGIFSDSKSSEMDLKNSVVTLTFGDQAENHAGMEKIGKMAARGEGFNLDDLLDIKKIFDNKGAETILYHLNDKLPEVFSSENAYVLVIRNALDTILSENSKYLKNDMFKEQVSLQLDTKAYMYGRVVNKKARYNLCFADYSQEPDYEKGKGRIVNFDDIPITNVLYKNLEKYFGPKAEDLKGEGNYYYDISKCGIGFHGDSERIKVVAVRIGTDLPLHYQWFINSKPIGDRIIIPLSSGDMYVMSEKAVGTDWKKTRKIPTLRHATGCAKFTTIE
jgi:hypothetical protein